MQVHLPSLIYNYLTSARWSKMLWNAMYFTWLNWSQHEMNLRWTLSLWRKISKIKEKTTNKQISQWGLKSLILARSSWCTMGNHDTLPWQDRPINNKGTNSFAHKKLHCFMAIMWYGHCIIPFMCHYIFCWVSMVVANGLMPIWHQNCDLVMPRDELRSWTTLVQVLMAPSHYLNQFWLFISEVLWHSPKWVPRLLFCMSLKIHTHNYR